MSVEGNQSDNVVIVDVVKTSTSICSGCMKSIDITISMKITSGR